MPLLTASRRWSRCGTRARRSQVHASAPRRRAGTRDLQSARQCLQESWGQVFVVGVNSPTISKSCRVNISVKMQLCADQPVALANARKAPAASSKALAPKSIPLLVLKTATAARARR
jgi:hypothetical protein